MTLRALVKKATHPALPPDFLFGVATADHQCEAYNGQDDIRDVWERVREMQPRLRATEFWTRYPEDVRLAQGLGCKVFRLSLSWARLEPTPGAWDAATAQHYRDVLKCIRAAEMKTVVTLHHNTWPVHVQAAGKGAGMLDDDFPACFAEYARNVARDLGDLIDYYVTINEPNQLVYGYIKAWWMRSYAMPPGLEPLASEQDQMSKVLTLIPNLFRAHALAKTAIQNLRPASMVGSNPLVLGLPRFLRRLVDFWAARVTSPNLRLQHKMFWQEQAFGLGRVDLSIAQLTLTPERAGKVLFSESYFAAHLCLLYMADRSLPQPPASWQGRIGVTVGTAPADQAASYFPKATVERYSQTADAVAALRRREIDAVFDDDVFLRPFAAPDLRLDAIPAPDQPFAIAMALGSRSLLNAVDSALRQFKRRDPVTNQSPWDAAMSAAFPGAHGDPPNLYNRKTVANVGRSTAPLPPVSQIAGMDGALDAIRRRGELRVGIHPGVPGLCMEEAGEFVGLEPALTRYIAGQILGTATPHVEFVALDLGERVTASRSQLWFLEPLRKTLSMLTTIAAADWWHLGMAGKLPKFLCPPECVGKLDFVGIDYYWGFDSVAAALRLPNAMNFQYAGAPVFPGGLYDLLVIEHERFPDKPILVIENGCVTVASGMERADYLSYHVAELQRAVRERVPVRAYLCWSITSNREWGLRFNDNSDFGLYHIALDADPSLTRDSTPASARYGEIISGRSA